MRPRVVSPTVIYFIGSLRDPRVPVLSEKLRKLGFEVFDDWYAAGPEADDKWRDYEYQRGHTFKEALDGLAAWHVFDYDHYHLDRAHIGVMLMPCGKSGHLELGYLMGQGKPGFVLFSETPDRYDVMYRFCRAVCFSEEELFDYLKPLIGGNL